MHRRLGLKLDGQPGARIGSAALRMGGSGVATNASSAATAAALTATFGLPAVAWVAAVRLMNGMDMGVATGLGSFGFFAARWVSMMAAMMLPGATPAVFRRAYSGGRVRAVPIFVASYLAVWTLVGLAVYALYRPHETLAAGILVIAAGVYEFKPTQEPVPPALPAERAVWICIRALVPWLELWTDADADFAWRDEPHLDDRDSRPRHGPATSAGESRHRCASSTGDRRTWSPHRDRAIFGSRTDAADVRRRRWLEQGAKPSESTQEGENQ